MSAAPTEEAAAKEAPPVQPEAAQDAADLFGGLKKKSKKKKTPADIDLGETKSEKPESENQSEAPEEKGTDALADDAPLDVRVNASQQK